MIRAVAAAAAVAGVLAAGAALGYASDATSQDLGSISLASSLAAVVLGGIALLLSEWGSARSVVALGSIALGAGTFVYWFLVIRSILRTT